MAAKGKINYRMSDDIRKRRGGIDDMPANLKMLRVQAKLDELFKEKIDLTDTNNAEEKCNKYYTRSVAALAIIMRCGIDYDVAAQSVTDGLS